MSARPRIFDHFTGGEPEDRRFSRVARAMTPRRYLIDNTAWLAAMRRLLGHRLSYEENMERLEAWLTAKDPRGRLKGVGRGAPS